MFAYCNNGLSFRAWNNPALLEPGEVYFDHEPTSADLTAAFPGCAAAQAAQAAQAAYNAAIGAGCQIASTGTPALNAVYPLDDSVLITMNGEQAYIAVKGIFTNGQISRAWLDVSGAPHIFSSTAAFTAFAEAIAQYIDALQTALAVVLAGGTWAVPVQPVTIP